MFGRRYSAVCVNDEESGLNANQPNQCVSDEVEGSAVAEAAPTAASLPESDPATNAATLAALQRAQRRKSLKANRSMKPMDVLATFFDERHHGKHNARSPTRKSTQSKQNKSKQNKPNHQLKTKKPEKVLKLLSAKSTKWKCLCISI